MSFDIFILESVDSGKRLYIGAATEINSFVSSNNSNRFINEGNKISIQYVSDLSALIESKQIYESLIILPSANCRSIDISLFYDLSIRSLNIRNKKFLIECEVGNFRSIEEISTLEGVKGELNLTNFPNLNTLTIFNWNKNLDILNGEKVKNLVLHSFKSENSLVSLNSMKSLCSLELNLPKILNLKGIDQFTELNKLSIHYASSLSDISALSCSQNIQELFFENCKKIIDFSVIGRLKKLRKLSFGSCGSIESLSFVKDLDFLEHLALVQTKVMDGSKGILNNYNNKTGRRLK